MRWLPRCFAAPKPYAALEPRRDTQSINQLTFVFLGTPAQSTLRTDMPTVGEFTKGVASFCAHGS